MNRVDVNQFGQQEARDTFFGPRVPPLVRALLACGNPKAVTTSFRAALAAVHDEDVPDLEELGEKLGITPEEAQKLLAGAHELITAVTRIPPTRLKKRTLEEDLDFLNAPPALKKHVLKLAFEDRESSSHAGAPGLEAFKWRVDVALSTSTLKRALKPSVLMQMRLSNGKVHTFEVPVNKFHQLRYNTAFALKELMEVAEKPAVQEAVPGSH